MYQLPLPAGVLDEHCRYLAANPAYSALCQLPLRNVLGRRVAEVMPQAAPWTERMVARVLAEDAVVTEELSLQDQRATHTITLFPARAGARTDVGFVLAPLHGEGGLRSDWKARYFFEELISTWASRLLAAAPADLGDVIVGVLRAVCEGQGYRRGVLVRFDDSNAGISIIHEWHLAALEPLRPVLEGRRVFSTGFIGRVLLSGQSVFVSRHEVPTDVGNLARVLTALNIEAFMAVPLVIEHKVLGCAVFELAEARAPATDDQRRQRLVSDLLATAIGRELASRAERAAVDEIKRLKATLEAERDYLRDEIAREHAPVSCFTALSPSMRRVTEFVQAVAATPTTVLVCGESGVGKELVARAIHAASDRRHRPLVKVNCASIPRDLFESEFFGHVRGAFTGATKDRVGRFELADGGTIFLDEVGEIPLAEQAKLLRVLQEGEFERVGDARTRKVDVRVIAATNRRLEQDVKEGRFRADLYFRLHVFPIEVPPLRERAEDLIPLAHSFLEHHAARLGRRGLSLSPEDRALLQGYSWPGNIRELIHVIERAVILAATGPFRITLPASVPAPTYEAHPAALDTVEMEDAPRPRTVADLRRLEAQMIREALAASRGRISGKDGAAEQLGLSASTLRDRMKALGVERC